jgi:hypothetical protein
MPKCTAITRGGNRCKGIAIDGSDYCYAHHPDHAEDRKRAASKGGKRAGRGRPSPATAELTRLQARFEDLADEVLSGAVDRGDAAVVAQLLNGARSCLVGLLKAREKEDVEGRLEEVEEILGQRKKNERRWRA